MSYALESKKRKFHRVLDSISNPKPSTPESASKIGTRPTLDLPKYPSIKRVRVSHGNEVNQASRGRSASVMSRPSSSSSTSSLPNFVPWDRERFLERLETFRRVDRWSPKPAAINEVEWARRGWTCTDIMRVECVRGCEQSVVVKLPEEIDIEDGYDSDKVEERKQVRSKLVDEYSRLIREGHGERCPWRNAGCDATIHRLPLTYTENAINSLRSRYLRLASLESKLPAFESIEMPEEVDSDEIIKILPPTFFRDKMTQEHHTSDSIEEEGNPEAPDNGGIDVNKTALILAVFGWDVVGDASAGLAGCSACFRRLGLWMYKPKDDGNVRVYNKLDVANEHLDYCPWVNAKAQSGGDVKPGKGANGTDFHCGWEVLLRTIRNKHRSYANLDSGASPGKEKEAGALEPVVADEETRRAKDKEWWNRLRKVRQALNLKSTKKPGANDEIRACSDILWERTAAKVVAINDEIVVKFGGGVEAWEGQALIYLEHVADVSAPRLYAMYHDSDELFLIMQRAPGIRLDIAWPSLTESEKDCIVAELRRIFDAMRKAQCPWPDNFFGGLDGGSVHHYLFYDRKGDGNGNFLGPFHGEASFVAAIVRNFRALIEYNNRPDFKARFYETHLGRVLQNHQPTLTHGDLQRRNIMIAENRSRRNEKNERLFDVMLVDWESAGWYPDFWEFFCASCMPEFMSWDEDWCWRCEQFLQVWPAELAMMRMLDKDYY